MARPFALAAAVLALTAALPAAANAAPAGDTRSVEVSFRDLDLAQESGVAKLDRRVRYAATQVCGRGERLDLADNRRAAACRTAAMDGAKPQVELAIAAARGGADYAANTVTLTPHSAVADR